MTVHRPNSLYIGMGIFGILFLSLILSTFQWSNQNKKQTIQDIFPLSNQNVFLMHQSAEDLEFITTLDLHTPKGLKWSSKLPHTPKQPGHFISDWNRQIVMQASQSGEVFAVSKDDGKILWKHLQPNLTEMSASNYFFPLKHRTMTLNFFFHMGHAQGQLIATQALLGKELWRSQLNDSLDYAYNTSKYLVLRYANELNLLSYKSGKLKKIIPYESEPCISENSIYYIQKSKLFKYSMSKDKTHAIKYEAPLQLSGQCGRFGGHIILAANTRGPLRPLLMTISSENHILNIKELSDTSAQFIPTKDYSNSLPDNLPDFLPFIIESYQQEQRNRSYLYLDMIELKNKQSKWRLRLPSQAQKTLDIALEWLHPFQFFAHQKHYILKHNGYLMSLNGQSGQLDEVISISKWKRHPLMNYHIKDNFIWGFLEDQWFSLNISSLSLNSQGEGTQSIEIINRKAKLKPFFFK